MKKKDCMIGWLMKCSSSCLIFMGCSLMITGFCLLLTGCTEKAKKVEKKNIKVETIFQAGERRMRPIFLTSAAASVGVLPMMIENNTLWSPMGAVIFFGTLISMVLIATILPVLYWIVFDKHGKYSLRKKTSCE